MHQWISLNEFYKLMENFLFFSNSFSNYLLKTEKYSKRGMNIDQSTMCYLSIDLTWHALQINGKFFSHFQFIFKLLAETRKTFERRVMREY